MNIEIKPSDFKSNINRLSDILHEIEKKLEEKSLMHKDFLIYGINKQILIDVAAANHEAHLFVNKHQEQVPHGKKIYYMMAAVNRLKKAGIDIKLVHQRIVGNTKSLF